MKRALLIALAIVILTGIALASTAAKDPYNIQVKKLYSAPDENSNLVFDIPIEVKLLDVSADANWHKVKIAFSFGPLNYTYIGWTKIPVGDVVAERVEKAKLAKALETEQIKEE